MRVLANLDICLSAGMCVRAAPSVFDQDDRTGLVVLLGTSVDTEMATAVRQAVSLCPSGAISIDE